MSVLVELYKVPETEYSATPFMGIKGCSDLPFPDEDLLKETIDLNELVKSGEGMTFYAKITNNNNGSAYQKDDILVVNRSWPLQNNKMVICCEGDEFVLKRVNLENDLLWLSSPNGLEPPLLLTEENSFIVWGVVTHEVRRLW